MKNIFFYSVVLVLTFFLSSCSSVQGKKADNTGISSEVLTETGDQIAGPDIAYSEKRMVAISSGTPKEYEYISGEKVVAKEILNDKGEVVSFVGEMPNGLIKQYDMEKKLMAEMNYNAGKLEGVNKSYYCNGQLAYVKNYKNGHLDGQAREFYDNGNKKSEASYKDGLLNGTIKKYSATGTFLSSAQYSDGLLDGVYKEYFVTGTPRIEIEYYNGKKEGASKEYYPNGTLKYHYNYSQDKLEGESKFYYEDGAISKIEKYRNNKLDGDTKIYSNNNSEIPMYIDTYVNGKKTVRKAFSGKGDQIFKIRY